MAESTEEKIRILLIDDEQNILRTFRYCLEDAGHKVATATDAAQAEQLVQRDVFDLCFLDLRLGETSGLDLLPVLRQYCGSPNLFANAMNRGSWRNEAIAGWNRKPGQSTSPGVIGE